MLRTADSQDVRVVGRRDKDVELPDAVHVRLEVRPSVRVLDVVPGNTRMEHTEQKHYTTDI